MSIFQKEKKSRSIEGKKLELREIDKNSQQKLDEPFSAKRRVVFHFASLKINNMFKERSEKMKKKLYKEVKNLKLFCFMLSITLCFSLFLAFKNSRIEEFEEINVKRINIVEEDGTLRLVISNRAKSPGALLGGRLLYPGGGRPGMIFFNEEGDECGGLIYGIEKRDCEESYFGGLMFDRHLQDQIVGIQYSENGGKSLRAGLIVWERPDVSLLELVERKEKIKELRGEERLKAEKELEEAIARGEYGSARLFAGNLNKTSMIALKDSQSRDRIRLYVEPEGEARLVFLDEKGEVVFSLPPQEK